MKQPSSKIYQLIIIGAGPAGLSAGIYAQRYGLDFLIIGQTIGGTVNEAHLVENYLGFKSISGKRLAQKFFHHLPKQVIKKERVKKISSQGTKKDPFWLITTSQHRYQTRSLILALGMKNRKLNLKNEDKFLGKGIFYGTPEQTQIFRGKTCAVVGGGDSALTSALKISKEASKVYLIHRRDEFRGAPAFVKKVGQQPNIELVLSAQVKEVSGKKHLEKIILNNHQELKVSYLFIEIGGVPNIHFCEALKLKMENNFVVVDKNQATNQSGVFAAGDLTNNPLKQIITAAAEGAIAATSAFRYLREKVDNSF